MLPTPSTSHVSFDSIYEPAEDSFLFLDTLSSSSETSFLHNHFSSDHSPTPLVLEVGPGSGVVIAFATAHARTIFGRDILSLAIDANEGACRATAETVRTAQEDVRTGDGVNPAISQASMCFLSSVTGDLCSPLLKNVVDVLIFNPPYVPTEDVPSLPDPSKFMTTEESRSKLSSNDRFVQSSHLLSLSYAGGVDGMEVTNRLLSNLSGILSERGIAYVLFCRQNKVEEVKLRIQNWPEELNDGQEFKAGRKWRAETVGRSGKTAGWEVLEIVRIWRE